ncbi:hypothetical protein [Oceanibium sediminis]|uniref:hypothetical protein n=1 Tax=Oceanibium sediminis TaxID=2026339 RepID=UPI0013006B6E|nr:hypothetical protein [Oceanibium sediminis]
MSNLIAIAAPVHEEAPDPPDLIAHAVWLLKGQGLVVTAQSALYRAPSGREGDGPDVVSSVIAARSDHSLDALIASARRVEAALGAKRPQAAPQIEVLTSGDAVLPDELTVRRAMADGAGAGAVWPHPQLHLQPRYLVPLAEVAPDWLHPVLGQTARALLEASPDAQRLASAVKDAGEAPRDVAE